MTKENSSVDKNTLKLMFVRCSSANYNNVAGLQTSLNTAHHRKAVFGKYSDFGL